jgi:hypothetical protein
MRAGALAHDRRQLPPLLVHCVRLFLPLDDCSFLVCNTEFKVDSLMEDAHRWLGDGEILSDVDGVVKDCQLFVLRPDRPQHTGMVVLLHGSGHNWLGLGNDAPEIDGVTQLAIDLQQSGVCAAVLDSYITQQVKDAWPKGIKHRVKQLIFTLQELNSRSAGPLIVYGKSNGGYALAELVRQSVSGELSADVFRGVAGLIFNCPFVNQTMLAAFSASPAGLSTPPHAVPVPMLWLLAEADTMPIKFGQPANIQITVARALGGSLLNWTDVQGGQLCKVTASSARITDDKNLEAGTVIGRLQRGSLMHVLERNTLDDQDQTPRLRVECGTLTGWVTPYLHSKNLTLITEWRTTPMPVPGCALGCHASFERRQRNTEIWSYSNVGHTFVLDSEGQTLQNELCREVVLDVTRRTVEWCHRSLAHVDNQNGNSTPAASTRTPSESVAEQMSTSAEAAAATLSAAALHQMPLAALEMLESQLAVVRERLAVTIAEQRAAERSCPVCLELPKSLVFQCGHQVCAQCAERLEDCPTCRAHISQRIRLY